MPGASLAAASGPSPGTRTPAASPAVKGKAARPSAKAKPAPTAIRPPKVPGLRISVSDGRTTVQLGDRLTYTVVVQNSGAHRSPRLKITQTMPPGVRFVSASRHGTSRAGRVGWYASVPAGGRDTFSAQVRVTRLAARQSRLAAVACAAMASSQTPIVCAAHLDRLPGVPATGPGRRASPPAASPLPGYAGILAALVAAALAVITGRRIQLRRRRRAS